MTEMPLGGSVLADRRALQRNLATFIPFIDRFCANNESHSRWATPSLLTQIGHLPTARLKGRPVLISNRQAEPGWNLLRPITHLLAHLCICKGNRAPFQCLPYPNRRGHLEDGPGLRGHISSPRTRSASRRGRRRGSPQTSPQNQIVLKLVSM